MGGGLGVRHGDRPGAGRRPDRALRLARDLPRAGADRDPRRDRVLHGDARRRAARPRRRGRRVRSVLAAASAPRDRARAAVGGADRGGLPGRAAAGRRAGASSRSPPRSRSASSPRPPSPPRGSAATPRRARSSGCLLVAGGIGCLALLPGASPWWTVPPQILAGAGMGLALPALAGELMPERTRSRRRPAALDPPRRDRAALALLAPIVSVEPRATRSRRPARRAPRRCSTRELDPGDQDRRRPAALRRDRRRGPARRARALGRRGARGPRGRRAATSSTGSATQLDDIVTGAVRSSFRIAFIVTAALALAAALLLLAGALSPSARGRRRRADRCDRRRGARHRRLRGRLRRAPSESACAIEDPCTGRPRPARHRRDRRLLPGPARSRPSTGRPASSAPAARSCCWRSSTRTWRDDFEDELRRGPALDRHPRPGRGRRDLRLTR